MNRHNLPPSALLLGLAGLLPFIGCGLMAVAVPEIQAVSWVFALCAYGAVVLAFLGGVHWGLVLGGPEDPAAPLQVATRLALGIAPSLIGWAAVLLALVTLGELGLAVLIVGFVAAILTESRLGRMGLVPPGYLWLRWLLSVIVLVVLVVVLVLRLIGAHIIF